MSLPFYQVDAFAEGPLLGNPAAVIPLETVLPDETLQAIAQENNLSETAFIVPKGEGVWDLRWFTPTLEVPLCGHATLASAHVVFTALGFGGEAAQFDTLSGRLSVQRLSEGRYEMDFPAIPATPIPIPEGLAEAYGATPIAVYASGYVISVFDSAETVRSLSPDIAALGALPIQGTRERGNHTAIAKAHGEENLDLILRFFAPGSGIAEDPATGSAACEWAPLFQPDFPGRSIRALQAFPGRGGRIDAQAISSQGVGARVRLIGAAITLIEGRFFL